MPELRKDPIVGRWVIIADERAKRPHDFKSESPADPPPAICPFCEGHEDKTPPEILAYRELRLAPNGPGWRVRVVPNRFPALKIEGNLNKRGDGIYDMMDGVGAHEVIIESPGHHTSMATLADREHPRGPLGLSRSARRLEDETAGWSTACSSRTSAPPAERQPRAHAQPVDRHADRADLGLGRNDRLARILQLSRPLHLLRHGPARAVLREAHRLDTPHFTAFCPFASRFPVRDLDRAQDALEPLREYPQARRRRPGARAASGPQQARSWRSIDRRTITSFTRPRSTCPSCRITTGISR